jgi:hypothetical protein
MLGPWEFDTNSDLAFWVPQDSFATASWVAQGEAGQPDATLGSEQIVVTTPLACASPCVDNVQFTLPTGQQNLAGRQVFFRVQAVTAGAVVKAYAIDLAIANWAWLDGGTTILMANAWTTVSVRFGAAPIGAFDPTQIWSIGLQIYAPGTVLIDRIWMQ